MDEPVTTTHLTVRAPSDLLDSFDKIALALDRPRTWVVLRALRQYLAAEGAELLRDAEGMAALDGGEAVDFDQAMDDFERLVDEIELRKSANG